MPQHFSRPRLAAALADQILSVEIGTAAASGVFLAAPRRTGKSTFLREDLRPALEKRNAKVIYVDLWADKQADPGDVIVAAVRSELATTDGVLVRLARKTGLSSVEAGGIRFALDQVGLGTNVSLREALSALSDELKRPIVLIIDEAQQAIVSERGYDALFALKAARDELNSSEHYGLRVVATGSNRDKLAMLRSSKDQAFFGAPLVEFPTLDIEYIKWFCARVKLPVPLDPTTVWDLFQRAAFRPEIIGAAADELRFDFALTPDKVAPTFEAGVLAQIEASELQTLQVIHSLTPLQSAVLRVLAKRQHSFAPFEAETMSAYAAVLTKISPNDTLVPDASNVQSALAGLQDKLLVWRERRGVYALEEHSTSEILESRGLLSVVPESNS